MLIPRIRDSVMLYQKKKQTKKHSRTLTKTPRNETNDDFVSYYKYAGSKWET